MTRNIVFIVLDTVRKDYFDNHASRIQDLSTKSFSRCKSASSWSVPSHASMLTGELAHQHGCSAIQPTFGTIDPSDTFLADLDNFNKMGISSNIFVSSRFGFSSFFDSFYDINPNLHFQNGIDIHQFLRETENQGIQRYLEYFVRSFQENNTIKSLANGIIDKSKPLTRKLPYTKRGDKGTKRTLHKARSIARGADEPYFLFINLMEAHTPFQPRSAYDHSIFNVPHSWSSNEYNYWDLIANPDTHREYFERRKELYSASIDYLDRIVSEFVSDIQQGETTFIITSDHGENIGENGELGHRTTLSERTLHVPLEIISPNADSEVIQEQVSQLQMPEIVHKIANNSNVDFSKFDFQSVPVSSEILGMCPGPELPRSVDQRFWKRGIRCVYVDGYKYIWDSISDCYKINMEKGCSVEVSKQKIKCITNNPFQNPLQFPRPEHNSTSPNEVDDSVEDRLSQLGYK